VPYCQKYAPSDCFFGDFVHWVYYTAYLCDVRTIDFPLAITFEMEFHMLR